MILSVTSRRVAAQQKNPDNAGNNPLGRVLKVYQENQAADPETLELRLDEAIMRETAKLERFLWLIKVVSVVAPLMGLLGTVTGMIRTFQMITLFGTGDPKLMASGISEALVTTMLGLMTAIPLVLLHALVSASSKRVVDVLDEQSTGMVATRAEEARALLEPVYLVRDFLETGGRVLVFILVTTFLMWTLMLERFWYFRFGHRKVAAAALDRWEARADRNSWNAHQIRKMLIGQVKLQLDQGIGMIKTLVALCPLLGLLGTVTGMIEVFDVMAVAGSGNARAMASGVSRATIPTMAGMVAAISGLIFSVQIERFASDEAERIADEMTTG